jgi:hypothetical protein
VIFIPFLPGIEDNSKNNGPFCPSVKDKEFEKETEKMSDCLR